MATVNVQFSDSTEATIVSYFGSPQDSDVYANYAEIGTSDARWKTYYEAQSAFVQQYLPPPAS